MQSTEILVFSTKKANSLSRCLNEESSDQIYSGSAHSRDFNYQLLPGICSGARERVEDNRDYGEGTQALFR